MPHGARALTSPLACPSTATTRAIEPRWQEIWEREQTWQVSNEDVAGKPKSYVLEMLPYLGRAHMEHLKNYAVGDAVAHFHRRTGRHVLHPIGYDAFGLPAENHAIKTGEHPRDSSEDRPVPAPVPRVGRLVRLVARARHQPSGYYRWTQWLFLRFLERGLAYRKGESSGQLVPQGRHGARQRAGHRRSLRTLRHAGRGAPAGAVVLPHHRLRRPPARRPGDDRLARAWSGYAQLDRPLRGRPGHVRLRGARHRVPGVHDAAGHALRRDLLRP